MRNRFFTAGTAIDAHPFYTSFIAFPHVCFFLTLLTDIAYWWSNALVFQDFSEWLLFAGLVVGGFVLLTRIVLALVRFGSFAGPGWPYIPGGVVVLLLALVNSFVHARDGWTAVVPDGLILSALTVIVMIVTSMVGVADIRRSTEFGATYHG